MRINGGVKSIMVGGRPNTKITQAVGGVKGAQAVSAYGIWGDAQLALVTAPTAAQSTILNKLTSLPHWRSSYFGFNWRDQIWRDNLKDGIPAHYVQVDADCRLYHTADMITNVENLWYAAAEAAWKGGKCVAGTYSYTSNSTKRDLGPSGAPVRKPKRPKREQHLTASSPMMGNRDPVKMATSRRGMRDFYRSEP